ncbi:Glucosamine-6-phosphate isomerase (Glucosamine-6-phosphate deaminase) (GNPDA) (GlcN6P deaminase) [Kalmusia sp. IMI 367209]|nr:Glucosamine-6-phosphate isomerase (Glucosamine-6-phosphate deaminase) (GNPDA) (GlcN6P deaminase) [Kalmusia sp. IMI 367209]
MRLIIREDINTAADYIAEYIIGRINTFAPTFDRPFVLGLPTGSSPVPIYSALVTAYQTDRISFRHVVTFNMDEYVGLPRQHSESYYSFMETNLFNHVDIDPTNINILDGNAPDLEQECVMYEAKIKKTIMDAKEVAIIATGASKALAIQSAIEGEALNERYIRVSKLNIHVYKRTAFIMSQQRWSRKN